MNGLAMLVPEGLKRGPHAGDLVVFRGRRGQLVKLLWHEGVGMSLYVKRLDHGRFSWRTLADEAVAVSATQLGYLLERIDWRDPAARLAAVRRRVILVGLGRRFCSNTLEGRDEPVPYLPKPSEIETGRTALAAAYDPNTFDELPIKYALGRIAARRKAARARLAKIKKT